MSETLDGEKPTALSHVVRYLPRSTQLLQVACCSLTTGVRHLCSKHRIEGGSCFSHITLTYKQLRKCDDASCSGEMSVSEVHTGQHQQ